MRDSDELVLLLLKRLLDLIELWTVANWGLQLRGLDAVGLKAVGEAVSEVAGVKDKDLIAGLGEVGCHLVPAEGAAAGDDKGLRGRIGGLEELAEHGESLAESVYEGHADVRFTVRHRLGSGVSRGNWKGMSYL